MIRLSSLVFCTALISTAAFAEGPQEKALDQSLTQMQAQDSGVAPAPAPMAAPAPMVAPATEMAPTPAPAEVAPVASVVAAPVAAAPVVAAPVVAAPVAPAPVVKKAKVHKKKAKATKSPATETTSEGENERRMDQGLQPLGGEDPAGSAVVHKLNGGK